MGVIWFVIGMMIGVTLGIILMCLVQINRENENINLRVKLERLIKQWKKIKENQKEKIKTKDYASEDERTLNKNVAIIAEIISEELENIL